ncbi:MAG: hypothetical protein NC320_07225 [Clostridium sp.]|nr:hypothetical protein [Clostridium sp.]MCM1547768.1 hypothetical protein [Ruminococcus sp.]
MANLSLIIERIYAALKGNSISVFREYEKLPVSEHERLYACVGISGIDIENRALGEKGKYYSESFELRIRIAGNTDVPFTEFYDALDTQLLGGLLKKKFRLESVKISAPFFDDGLRRMVLECSAKIRGRMEALNGSQY